jgi:hypothetical protein
VIANAAQLLAAGACVLAAGAGVLRLVTGRWPLDWAHAGLAYMAGVAAVGVIAQLVLVLGGSLSLPAVLALCGGLFALGFARRGADEREAAPAQAGLRFAALGAALTAAYLTLLAVDLAFQPLFRSDAWAQWTPKAESIVFFGGLDLRVFANEAYATMNLDYPLLVPAIEAIDLRFMGFDTQLVHLQFWLLLAGFIGAFVALARGRVPPGILWAFAAALALAPTLAYQSASAYADVPLAAFFALAGMCAWRWLADGRRSDLALTALFAAAACATKTEGLVFVAALFLVLVPLAWRISRREAGAAAVAAVASLVGIVPWRLWAAANDVPAQVDWHTFDGRFLTDNAGRLPTVVWRLARDVADPRAWLLLLPLGLACAAVAAVFARSRGGVVLALGVPALALLGLVWIYWSTPYDLAWHLGTSSDRVVIGPVVFLAALGPFLLASALERA